MMELPNYSSQLMQQLWSLRNEGQFCDCTILVGDSPHHAHKVVLAASSMLFRSLLNGSDTISIDTEMVSSQEFLCLLDMVYTGKLPLGKHNVSRIIAAADSLQMFDVAVGFKNILTCLVNRQPSSRDLNKNTAAATNPTCAKAEGGTAVCVSPGSQEQPSTDCSQDAPKKEGCRVEGEDAQEQMCRTACEDTPETSEAGRETSPDSATDGSSTLSVKVSDGGPGLLQHLVEVLTRVSSVTELLSQAAQNSLAEEERQVVCRCCEEAGSSSSLLEALLSRVKEGRLSQESLLRLLHGIQRDAPSSLPPALHPLPEEVEEELQQDPSTTQGGESEGPSCTAAAEEQEAEKDEDRDEDSGAVPDAAAAADDDADDDAAAAAAADDDDAAAADAAADAADAAADARKPYPCRWCKKTFAYKCRMLTHMKRCPSSKRSEQQCPECPTRLCSQRALRQHQAAAHRGSPRSKKKVACDLCGRTFAHPSGMIYHKRSEHFDEKPFSCEECGATFAASSSLKNHVRLHTGEKPYRCKHCDMSFAVAAALAYHTKKKHLEGKMYVCQYCKAIFAQSIELTRHVRTHTGDRPYVCRECGKGYNQASRLSVHLQTSHNLSQPHDCQRCCLSFATLEEHRQHIQKVHPKEFHKCASCDKVLSSAALLEKHEATHRLSKPFSCELCNKSYQQLSGLWYHNRTNHPDVFANQSQPLKNLLQCDVCFKFFPTAASLSRHQATEHQSSKASPVQCPFCPTTLGGDEELQEHLLSVHVELQVQEQVSTSHAMVSAEPAGSGGSELVVPVEHQAQQQVLVALARGGGGGGAGAGGGAVLESAAQVMEVNVFGLLNNSVTFICEEKSPESATLTAAGATPTPTPDN